MGRHRERLIIQADLTSEEDEAFLAWVLERRRKRHLAEEIRQGLHLQYLRRTGHTEQSPADLREPPDPEPLGQVTLREPEPATRTSGSVASKLARLVGGF
jgi:hypothetical protein